MEGVLLQSAAKVASSDKTVARITICVSGDRTPVNAKMLIDDDKLIKYDALLLDKFLDILQDLHGEDMKETLFDEKPKGT
ncbi:hypothetical protein L1987_01541 [Smallanthus sonchifolius]|uniref:Uncharacterized protein n=1 Tax=Smallanthus sonchifolius TaxID=185202 RepID=A0ACB9K5K3_9ASTR|nr:hypothetical protein L1987_01541 [Smallanthus sonchifolius]